MKTLCGARGFTLLEATVAMAMLATSLIGLYYVNYGAMQNHAYSKQLTVASLLARSKMVDLEQKLYDDGLQVDDQEDDGDFSDEGWPSFKWRATIIAPKTEGLPPEQLLAALFNIPMGGGDDKNGSGSADPLSALMGAIMGGGAGGKVPGADGMTQGGGGIAGMLGGAMSGMMQGQFNQLVDTITKSVREVHLTVYWKDGKNVESFDVVTHVVSMGPGSDRNGGVGAGGAPPGGVGTGQPGTPLGGNPSAPPGGGIQGMPPGPGIPGMPPGAGGVTPFINPLNSNGRQFGGNRVLTQ